MPTNILDLPSYTVMGPEADRKDSRSSPQMSENLKLIEKKLGQPP